MKLIPVVVSALLLPVLVTAQEPRDSVNNKRDTSRAGQFIGNITRGKMSQRLLKSITRKSEGDPTRTVRSEEAFLPYEGKIIRRIDIRQLGFEKTVYDTTRNIRSTITRLGNALHSNSRDWLIHDNLFVKKNRPLNPWKLADNERYLRDLDFILDARFYIVPLAHTSDSVDLVVVTRDVFSIGGSFSPGSDFKSRFALYDANLAGWGQRVQINGLFEDARDPSFLYEVLYRKNSIGGSFVNGTVGYTQLNSASSYGPEEENAYYLRFDRPLVSPYTTFAGGMELSKNWSENYFQRDNTLFRDYRYVITDFWIGYNIGAKNNMANRNRHFLAIRAFEQHFTRQPEQTWEKTNPLYNNRRFVLSGLTFFKQNFYTTSYIYGFGRTEDVPYGHHLSFYAGGAEELGRTRAYFGLEAEKRIAGNHNEFYTLGFRAGGYHHGRLEDGAILAYASLLSQLIEYRSLLIRQLIDIDYARVFRQHTSLPLNINDSFGIRGFHADSLLGTKRFHIHTETVAFTTLSLFGFRIAPFIYGEMAFISQPNRGIFYDKPYYGFGGGLRTRNENLIFGTVELRISHFPRTLPGISTLNLSIIRNLRMKYTATFVKAPDFVRYN